MVLWRRCCLKQMLPYDWWVPWRKMGGRGVTRQPNALRLRGQGAWEGREKGKTNSVRVFSSG